MRKKVGSVVYPVAAYTATPGDGSVLRCWRHACNVLFILFRQTWCDRNFAVNRIEIHLKTRCHIISPSRFVVEHIIKHSPFCDEIIKGSWSHGRQSDSPCCWKRGRNSSCELLLFCKDPACLDLGLETWLYYSFKAMRVKDLSFWLLLIAGRKNTERRSVWPSTIHQFHILQIIIGSRQTRTAIIRYDKPQSDRLQFDFYQCQTRSGNYFSSYMRHHNKFLLNYNRQIQFVSQKLAAQFLCLKTL